MFKASLRVWKFLIDVVGNTPKSSAIPNFAKSGWAVAIIQDVPGKCNHNFALLSLTKSRIFGHVERKQVHNFSIWSRGIGM